MNLGANHNIENFGDRSRKNCEGGQRENYNEL